MLKLFAVALLAIYTGVRLRTSVITDEVLDEYDFIIVGGGTTGVALAGRLSEDSNVKVLLLEAGKSDASYPSIRVPAYEPLQLSDADWDYRTVPQLTAVQSLIGKIDRWPRGKVLGGTSSMNHNIYHRGSRHDYDSWQDHGASGWSWDEVEPFFVKAEGATDDELSKKLGRNGPLSLTKGYVQPFMNDLMQQAAAEIGIEKNDYIEKADGYSEIVSTIIDGMRENSVEAYLRKHFPERKKRLHIMVGAHVSKILFDTDSQRPDNTRAAGVEFTKDGETKIILARKEIVLSAGAVGTPQLLMLSGIGPREHLENHGIPVIADLPGVGNNLQDHMRMMFQIFADTLPADAALTSEKLKNSISQYVSDGTGPLLTNLVTAFVHHRTIWAGKAQSASTNKRPFPEIQVGFYPQQNSLQDFQDNKETETYRLSDYAEEATKAIVNRNGVLSNFVITVGLQHPKSSGTIRLNSTDPLQHPLIDPMYLSNPDDVDVYIDGLKLVERLLDTDTFQNVGARQVMQPYCKEFMTGNTTKSDDYYRCWIRQSASSQYHPCCSAKIGAESDQNAVVDERLRVYGTKGLRIADASVMPHQTSGNTQAVCYMIAEKAAHMIKEEWSMEMEQV